MNKKEILDKAKKENLFNDEAKNNKGKRGDIWGVLSGGIVWAIFVIMHLVKGMDANHLISISFAYVGFSYLGKYFANKEKSDLISAIMGIAACLAYFLLAVSSIWNF